MKNHVNSGASITFAALAAAASGEAVMVGALFGVAQNTAAIGEDLTLVCVGGFELSKTAGEAWAVGDALYYDASEESLTTSAATDGDDNVLVGCAAGVAVTAATLGVCRLNGKTG